jgi:hypothetical protein
MNIMALDLAHPKGPQKPARELNTTCDGQFTLPSVPRKSWQIWILIYLYPKKNANYGFSPIRNVLTPAGSI